MDISIRKCPFCYGNAYLYVNSGGVCVKCEDCGNRTQTFNDCNVLNDSNVLVWPDKLAVEHVIRLWNKRADDIPKGD